MISAMIKRIKLRIRDMKTITALCNAAEKCAHDSGEESPGEEHWLVASIGLSDGTARRAFERIGADPDELLAAISRQHNEALGNIGFDVTKGGIDDIKPEIKSSKWKPSDPKPSVLPMLKQLNKRAKQNKNMPLLGAHIVGVIAKKEQGIAARALRVMGIDQQALVASTEKEVKVYVENLR